jgi:acyl-homoserine-lactone acylase
MANHSRLYLLVSLLALGCSETAPPGSSGTMPRYSATIRRTGDGIPHITSNTLAGVSFGQGYAFAQDNACTLLDQIVKVRSERARFLGPGPGNIHVQSDFAYLALGIYARAQGAYSRQTPVMQETLQGYAAGFNQYLSDVGAENVPGGCAGQPWVRPITGVDLMAHHLTVALLASSYQLIPYIVAAQPPGTGGQGIEVPPLEQLAALRRQDFGSNGWALGAERTANGRGMVLANPHFPWEGELRLWESHLTVPGQFNVYGAGVLGVPGVLIGFNESVAWTHTFSAGSRFTVYLLPLVPGSPTTYVYEGQPRQMTAREVKVQVRQADGSLQDVSRTYYSSHYGPIISVPGAEWNPQFALSLRDANLDNEAFIAQFNRMNKARDLTSFKQAFANVQGIPWVNTMAADAEGNVWYTDTSATPNLSPAALQGWQQALGRGDPLTTLFYTQLGIVLLDGSRSANEWQSEAGARSPGLVPYSRMPQLSRRDFVFNSNDSYWLANPQAPLTGFSPLHGLTGVPQSPRTRMNAVMLTEVREGGASGADGRFTLEELQGAVLSNRSLMAELLRADVVQRCQGQSTGMAGGQPVNIAQACSLLASWDGRFEATSVGAVVWREFLGAYTNAQVTNAGPLFSVPFSASEPVSTPHTLTPAPGAGADPLLDKLAEAVVALGRAGVALDKPLGEVQFSPRGGKRFPLHGGQSREGVANVVNYSNIKSTLDETADRGQLVNTRTSLSSLGYVINSGTSFLMTMEFTDEGPNASAILTYGQSANPASPHFSDQTERFSRKEWRKILFKEEDIQSDPGLEELVVESN